MITTSGLPLGESQAEGSGSSYWVVNAANGILESLLGTTFGSKNFLVIQKYVEWVLETALETTAVSGIKQRLAWLKVHSVERRPPSHLSRHRNGGN